MSLTCYGFGNVSLQALDKTRFLAEVILYYVLENQILKEQSSSIIFSM